MIKAVRKVAFIIISFWAYVDWVLWVWRLKIKYPAPRHHTRNRVRTKEASSAETNLDSANHSTDS